MVEDFTAARRPRRGRQERGGLVAGEARGRAMQALGLGVLTGVLAATVAVSLAFALTDRAAPLDGRASLVGVLEEIDNG
jgi:hypothetical protein